MRIVGIFAALCLCFGVAAKAEAQQPQRQQIQVQRNNCGFLVDLFIGGSVDRRIALHEEKERAERRLEWCEHRIRELERAEKKEAAAGGVVPVPVPGKALIGDYGPPPSQPIVQNFYGVGPTPAPAPTPVPVPVPTPVPAPAPTTPSVVVVGGGPTPAAPAMAAVVPGFGGIPYTPQAWGPPPYSPPAYGPPPYSPPAAGPPPYSPPAAQPPPYSPPAAQGPPYSPPAAAGPPPGTSPPAAGAKMASMPPPTGYTTFTRYAAKPVVWQKPKQQLQPTQPQQKKQIVFYPSH